MSLIIDESRVHCIGYNLAQLCRLEYPRFISRVMWLLGETTVICR